MLAAAVAVCAVGQLSTDAEREAAKAQCIGVIDSHITEVGTACYFGSSSSQRNVIEAGFGGILDHCDLATCNCNSSQIVEINCEEFAVASLHGYVNAHPRNAAVNDLYNNMSAILTSACGSAVENGIPMPEVLNLKDLYGSCGADNAVSQHTGGIGAYVAVYAALFTLVMVETTERSRYTVVPSDEPVVVAQPGADASDFL